MGAFETVERRIWQAATGSSHHAYRQALWRPTRQPLETVSLNTFEGDPDASKWNRRQWSKMGVVGVRREVMADLLSDGNVDPAVAFAMGKMLVVGKLASGEDFGYSHIGPEQYRAHGFRIGPDDAHFGIGVVKETGEFIMADAEDTADLGRHNIQIVDMCDTRFQDIRFS